jgi:hypothetical protein
MCIDIARDAVRMMEEGKNLASMQREIDSKYRKISGKSSHTETGFDRGS